MYIIHLEYTIHLDTIYRDYIPLTPMFSLSEGGRYIKSVTPQSRRIILLQNHLITEGGGFESSPQSMNTSDIRRPGVRGLQTI